MLKMLEKIQARTDENDKKMKGRAVEF